MPKTNVIGGAIEAIVAEKVNAMLAPYVSVLDRFAELVGGQTVRRGPGRPKKVALAAPAARRARRGSKGKKLLKAVGAFAEGQKVMYRQGRGSFEAKVVRIDKDKGALTLERVKDGKRIVRPATKVASA